MSKAFVIPTQFTAVDRFSSPVRRMSDSVERFAINSRASLAFAERGFRRLMAPISAINRMMMGAGVYVGLYSFINVLRGVIKTIADFQEAQINIATVTHRSVSENKALSDQARKMAIQYGMAAESVSNLQYELIKMGLAEKKGGMQNIIDATPAITLGAKAMNAPVDELAKIVGAGMNLFGKSPQELVDLYAVGLDKSAMDFSYFSTMISNSQQAFAKSGRPLEELIVMMAAASNGFVHAASAGTGVKNMLIDNSVESQKFMDQMNKIASSENPLETMYKMYGRKTFQVIGPIVDLIKGGDWEKSVAGFSKDTVSGYSQMIADTRMQGINQIFNKVKASWQELILSIDEGSGKISAALTNIGKITTAMFLLASGSDIAREQLTRMDAATIQTAQSWLGLIEKVWTFIKILFYLKALMIAYKAVMLVVTLAQGAFNVALGVQAFLGRLNARTIIGNTTAMFAYRAATLLTTPALWAMNTAMWASPLFVLAIAIVALVGGFSLMNSWIGDITSGFNGMTGAVNGYSQSINNIPTPYSSEWFQKQKKDIEFSMLPEHIQRQQTSPVYQQKDYMSLGDKYARTEEKLQIDRVPSRDMMIQNGTIDININDPAGLVKSVDAPSELTDMIKVKTNSTFGNQTEQNGFRATRNR